MSESLHRKVEQKRGKSRAVGALCLVLAVVVIAVVVFFRFYSYFIEDTLYEERLSQMREVTTQLFSGLEDAVKNQWRVVDEQGRMLNQYMPQSIDQLVSFMGNQTYLGDLEAVQSELVAIDDGGACYTSNGQQGLLQEREYLLDSPDHITFVSNSLTRNESRMMFLRRLDTPITVNSASGTVNITYYGISQNMEELNPYFECSAYNGHNSVYVIDNDGLKLFSSSSSSSSSEGELLKGYNILTTLSGMDYLHGSSFSGTLDELERNGIAYSNALFDDVEVYYSLYRMDNAVWTLVFMVPSLYVATNTVGLVETTKNLVIAFAIALVAVSVLSIFWLMQTQQKAAVAVERRNNQKLERLNAQLEQASRAKSNFLANMSHDIRTPMNAIVGITSLMEHEKDNPEKLESYIRKVQSSSRHLLSLINDVLDMSKIESAEVLLNRERLDLMDQVSQVEGIIRPQAEERGQRLSVQVHGVAHPHLIGDAVRLRQVFINLLSNAVKYTPNGGVITFEVTELASVEPGRALIRIKVVDNGCGMAPEFAQRIFDPFTRAENSTTNKEQGTGLGMSITKNIVEMSGGAISVESALGQGSTFTVEMPFDIDEEGALDVAASSEGADEAEPVGATLAGMRFLCAEDNTLNAEILEAILDMEGASCMIYPNGRMIVDAFASVSPGQYDAILMDVQMPVMNGLDATRAIRSGANPLGASIPIIAMTANAFSSDVRDCLDAGMNAHVSKPLEIAALERTLRSVMRFGGSGGGARKPRTGV